MPVLRHDLRSQSARHCHPSGESEAHARCPAVGRWRYEHFAVCV